MPAVTVLQTLAASPDTPPVLLDRLVAQATATTGRRDLTLRATIAANPAVPPAHVARVCEDLTLVDGRSWILSAALSRPGMTAADALTVLGDDTSTAATVTALELVDDPTGALVTHTARHAHSTRAWYAVLTHPAATLDQRREVALALAAHPGLSARHAAAVTRFAKDQLAWARPGERTSAEDWLVRLRAAATTALAADTRPPGKQTRPHRRLLDETADLTWPGPAPTGSPAWITNPATPTGDVTAWADHDPAKRWPKVLRTRHDPDHTLAAAAPVHLPTVARAALGTRRTPTTIRQAALLTLTRDGQQVPYYADEGHLFRRGDPDLAVALLQAWQPPMYAPVNQVAARTDLTADHIDVVAAWVRQHGRLAAAVDVDVWVATHPGASDEQRAAAADRVRTAPTPPEPVARADDTRAVQDATYAAVTAAGPDTHDPDWPTRLVGALPTQVAPAAAATYPGIAAALTGAIAQLADTRPGWVDVFVALAETFTGTVADLLTTVEAITT